MSSLDKLTELFIQFPGIGLRQARRFSYFIASSRREFADDLINTIQSLRSAARHCAECRRIYEETEDRFSAESAPLFASCLLCRKRGADSATLMIVEKDIDLENIVSHNIYQGRFFVLGNLRAFPAAGSKIHSLDDLVLFVKKNGNNLKEIICACNANPEGDTLTEEIRKVLKPLSRNYSFSITTLGRGLSTGSELQYVDTETLKNALENRQ